MKTKMKYLKTFDQINEKLQYSNVAMLWGKMYGEDFDEEYPAITRELKTKYRKGFTKDELADLWSKRYGEDMPIEYEGFWRNLKEAKGWGGAEVIKWKPAASGGHTYLQIQLDKKGIGSSPFYHKPKGAYVGDYILEIPYDNDRDKKNIIKLLTKIDNGGESLEESLQTVEEAMSAMERKYINESKEQKLAKEVATLIGRKLDPTSFYEYLEDYSKDEPNGEYGFNKDQLKTLTNAFSYIFQDGLGMTDLNTSAVKSSKLYKAYLKESESVNEGILTTAAGVALGLVGAIALLKGAQVAKNIVGNIALAAGDKYAATQAAKQAAKRKADLEKIVMPIVKKFEDDTSLKSMYKELPPYEGGVSKKAMKNNEKRKKQLQVIAKYIKSKLTTEEDLYFKNVSKYLRDGVIESVNEGNFNLEDLKYQIPLSIENTGLNPRMFKAVKKEGKNYRVVLSSYASEMQMQQILGDTNLTLDSSLKILDGPKKGQNAIFIIGEAVDNFKGVKFPESFTVKDTLHYSPMIDGKPKKFFKGTYHLKKIKGKTAIYFNRAFKAEVEIDPLDITNFGRTKSHFKVNERKKYTETEFTKPGEDGDVYFSKREGNAIAIRQGDKLQMLSDFQGNASLAKIIGSDKRWENMGKPSEKLLIDLALKNVGGLNTRERSTERGKLLYKFITAGLKESMGNKIKNPVRHTKVAYKVGDMEKLLSGKLKLDDEDKDND